MIQRSLFDMGQYPDVAGSKERGGTSQEAAKAIEASGDAAHLRTLVLATLKRCGPLTADEIASRLRESVLAIRPRCSELVNQGKVRKTDKRRPNRSGRSATVLELVGEA